MTYEIWDRENNKLLVLDEYNMKDGKKAFLRNEDWIYTGIEGFPVELLVFNQDPERPTGISDFKMWDNLALGSNLLNSMHYQHVKRFNRKYLVKKGSLDPGEEEKLMSPRDGTIVEVNGDPISSVSPVQDATVTPDLYAVRDTLRKELEFVSGVTEQRKGSGDTKARTATEASIMESMAKVRDSDRVYLVAKFVERSWKKILQLDRSYLDASYVSFITSPLALQLWTQDSDAILKAEVDVKVRVGSSAYQSREVRTKQLLDFLNITGQMVDPVTHAPVVRLPVIIRRVADALDIEDIDELIFQPNPMATAMGGPPGPPGPGGQPSGAKQRLRNGAPNLGNLLSSVQNVGARPTNPPNPRNG